MDMIDKEVSSCLGEGKAFPPGFRFHPTDEELLLYYLKRKMCRRRHRLDVIGETDVCRWEPEELPGISKLRTGDRQWFFFSPRDRKYPTGGRSNRATKHGYWKATGKDRIITCDSRNVGVKKTLVFYKGRAPKGERTDWVMHEYTMTEEEIKSCQSVKDNYALYKVFKKSGPGPKNGEQYGAPFMEEDWLDGLDANDLIGKVNNVTHVEAAIPVSDNRVNSQLQSHGDDYEEFMNTIACEPISVQPLAVDYGVSFAELLEEEESQNVFVGEALPSMQQYTAEASFDITQSGTSHLQLTDSPNTKSAAKSHIPQQSNIVEGDIEYFLALDDLIGPEFTTEHTDRPTQILEDVHFDGLGEFDLYQDLPEFLSEGEAGGQGLLISLQNTNNLGNGVANPVSDFSNNNFVGGTANLSQAYLWNGNDANIVRWSYDQRRIVHTPGQARQGTVPIATPDGWYGMTMSSSSMLENSGVVYDSNSVKHQTGASKNNSLKQGDGTDSWFSSSIWAFVESIPTTPASAAESALVNHSFENCISSFSGLRTNSTIVDVAAVSTRANSISSSKCEIGLFCFSLLGILCAILWMFMGTSK